MAWADTLITDEDGFYLDPNDGYAIYSLESDGYYWNYDNSYAYDSDGNEHNVTASPAGTPSGGGGFWGDLLSGIEGYITNKDVINQALGSLTGFNVRNNPNPNAQGGSVKTGNNGNNNPPPQKSSNTVLYVVGGIVVLGMIVTMVVVISQKKK